MFHRRTVCAAFLVVLYGGGMNAAYELGSRWTETASNGGGLTQGDPTTLTWGFVPDGTEIPDIGTSDLIGYLETEVGTSQVWMPLFEQAFSRWDELSGLTLIHEPNDDGAPLADPGLPGELGIRGDVRIGGAALASTAITGITFFPDVGDIVLNTEVSLNPINNHRQLRNLVMQMHGLGLGISIIGSDDSHQLMEQAPSQLIDGPQFDDLLAVQRGYGDVYEENGGNDSLGSATPLGTVASGSSISIGTQASNLSPVIDPEWTDFVSIDDNSDFDFYSFEVISSSTLDISVDPRGPVYTVGQFKQSELRASELSDLTLQLYDTGGNLLIEQDAAGRGGAETISGFTANPGQYYLRVSGRANDIQMYRLDVIVPAAVGDFDGNGSYDCLDIDSLVAAVASGSMDPQWDLNDDGAIDTDDVTEWLEVAGAVENPSGNAFLPADANLDGVVDGVDFTIWNANRFTVTPAWCAGDFDANGFVDGVDFTIWNDHRFQSADSSTVPEPTAAVILIIAMLGVLWRLDRHRSLVPANAKVRLFRSGILPARAE